MSERPEVIQNEERQDISKEDKHQDIKTEFSSWGKVGEMSNVDETEEEKEHMEHTREKPIEPMETELLLWGNMEEKPKIAQTKETLNYVDQTKEQTTDLESFTWEKTGAKPKVLYLCPCAQMRLLMINLDKCCDVNVNQFNIITHFALIGVYLLFFFSVRQRVLTMQVSSQQKFPCLAHAQIKMY